MSRKLEQAREIAKQKGLNYQSLEISNRKGKRFSIINKYGERIHFGSYPYSKGTFLDHANTGTRAAWYARHGPITKETLLYYAATILW